MKKTLYILRSYFAKILFKDYNLTIYYLLEYFSIGMSIFIIFLYIYYIIAIMWLLFYQYFDFLIFFDNLINESIKIYEEPNLGKSCHCQGNDNDNRIREYKNRLDDLIQERQENLVSSLLNLPRVDDNNDALDFNSINNQDNNQDNNQIINNFNRSNNIIEFLSQTCFNFSVAESRRILETDISKITFDTARDLYTIETKFGVSQVKYNTDTSYLANTNSDTWTVSDTRVNSLLLHSNDASDYAKTILQELEKLKVANDALSLHTGKQEYSTEQLNELYEAADIIKNPNWIFGPVTKAESFRWYPKH